MHARYNDARRPFSSPLTGGLVTPAGALRYLRPWLDSWWQHIKRALCLTLSIYGATYVKLGGM
jgi:hypothetical protein